MAYLALAVGAIGGIVGAIGQIQAGNAAAAAGNYNASISDQNASRIRAEAAVEVADKQREIRKQLGSIRAAYGASGIDFSGSPLDVLADSATEGAWDVTKIKYKAEVAAVDQENQANLYRMGASSAQTAGYLGAGASFLSGVSQGVNNTDFGSFNA